MSCQRDGQVQAYHDGELPADQREPVEQHLRECVECSELLAELRHLSALVQNAPRPSMSAEAMRRLEQAWWRQRDHGVLRLAEWLTAAAAAVIILNLAIFSNSANKNEGYERDSAMAWQAEALTPPAQTRDDSASDVVAVAEWMANDLSDAAR
jgi:anti-sigma factor RsiW